MARKLRGDAHSQSMVFARVTPRERALILQAARVNRQSVSDFARDAVLTAVGDCVETRPTSRKLVKLFLSSP